MATTSRQLFLTLRNIMVYNCFDGDENQTPTTDEGNATATEETTDAGTAPAEGGEEQPQQ